MKKLFPLAAICVAFIFTSCEQETQPEITNSANLQTNSDTNQWRPPGGGPDDPGCGEENMFERQLHWFSFIAADVARLDPAVRQELNSYVSSQLSQKVLAENLIGSDTQTPLFQQAFYSRLLLYIHGPGHPSTSSTTPPFPIGSGGLIGGSNEIADAYIDVLLNQNCVELYFPIDLTLRNYFPSFTATAHPLTTSGANEGIMFKYDDRDLVYVIEDVVVNATYVSTSENVIVARPFKEFATPQGNSNCAYSEYSGIDFTEFLE